MLGPYRTVLAVPGGRAFSAAGLLARMPISMLGIGIVLLVSGATGSYALAGAVAATFGVVQAVAAPRIAALVDRFGQARVLRPAVLVHVAGLLALVTATLAGAPRWTLFGAAAVAGAAMGSVGALVRSRWTYLLGPADRRLHAAFALESVLDEVVFIVGPVVVTLLATRVSPPAGLAAAATAALLGGLLLAALRSTEPPASGHRPGRGAALLRRPGMVALVVAFVFVGALFGGIEVVTVAFTDERGQPGATAVVLAAFAFGSLLAGLGYGAVHWRSPVARRFRVAVLLLALGVLPVPLVSTVPALTLVTFVAGFSISPMLIAGNALVQQLVPGPRLTEGLTWVATALGIGTAAGAAVCGWVIDVHGTRPAYAVATAAGLLAAATALLAGPALRPPAADLTVRPRGAAGPATATGSPPAGRPR